MKWKVDLPNPIMLMYYCAKLIGLAPFTLKKDKLDPPTLWGKIYPVIFLCIVSLLTSVGIRKKLDIEENNTSELTLGQSVGVSYIVISWVATSLIIIILAVMHKKIIELGYKLCSMSDNLKKLGIEDVGGKILRNCFATAVMVNIVLQTIIVARYFFDPKTNIVFTTIHNINNLVTFNMVLIFSQILLCIGHRFTLVNEKLCNFHPTQNYNSPLRLQSSEILAVDRNPPKENREDVNGLTDIQRIRKMEALHLELCDLVDRTTYIFAAPILLDTFRLLCKLLTFSYWSYRITSNAIHLTAEEYFSTTWLSDLTLFSKLVFSIIELFIIARACVTTCRQGNATKIVLSKLRNKIDSSVLQDELYMFFIQLLHTPVVISVYEFFDIDYGLLYKIFCTVVAYVVVMIQLEDQRPISGT